MEQTKTSQQINIRLRSGEREALEAEAQSQGKTLTEWSRDVLLEAVKASPGERRLMRIVAIGAEVNRLTLIAVQDQQDLSLDSVRQGIEMAARTRAEGILDRWLSQKGCR